MECGAIWVGLNSWHQMKVCALLRVFFFLFNNVMHFPIKPLCKQVLFLPDMSRCALLLLLPECLQFAAQQPPEAGVEQGGFLGHHLCRFSLSWHLCSSEAMQESQGDVRVK